MFSYGSARAGVSPMWVIHGDDVDYLFKPDFLADEYIKSIFDNVSYDNRFNLPAKDFFERRKRAKARKTKIHPIIKTLEEKDYTNIIYEWIEDLDIKEVIKITETALIVCYHLGTR